MTQPLSAKLASLEKMLSDMQSILIAYSGGTDSTFLLKVAAKVLGDRAVAVTASSETYTAQELRDAKKHAEEIGAQHVIVHTNELEDPQFAANPPDRCYYCKKELFSKLTELKKRHGLNYIVDGSTVDDEKDFRPGMRAVVEFGVRSPLKDAGFMKDDIRKLSKEMNLPTWDKPPLPCLSTRFPYGTEITKEKVARVARAEEFLSGFGIRQLRVRDHGNIARIEVTHADMPIFIDEGISKLIAEKLKSLGYAYVTLDVEGYRMGSMNEPLKEKK
ncbi:MAG TPA: ATP-dependent sacrificial sulfur transferase LarE [Syntrophales bacterium]|nr:ATP-dependent sacrificial sulfur transferase LarE [Syntrophales bacterium]